MTENIGSRSNVGVAIVAPGGYAPEEATFERALTTLASYGCQVKNYYDPAAKFQRFGGTDLARMAQLHAAANDPDVHIVMSLRGGYGMSRLLESMDFPTLEKSGKLFVGHSDFTAFQMGFLARTGGISFAGPMICDDFSRADISEFTMQHFWQCVNNPEYVLRFEAEHNPVIDVSGILWGGNLTMLAHLVGTPYFPNIVGGILFIEDVNEHPYRIERMLLQLFNAGVLSRQKAVVFGEISNYRLSDYDNGYGFEAMLAYARARFGVPILTGLSFGHIRDKVTLPVGCVANLSSNENGARLSMSGYPNLSPR